MDPLELENRRLPLGQENPEEENFAELPRLDENAYRRIIRDMGLKITQQRMAIMKSITAGRKHVTAQEVFEKVMVNSPDVGFATVYRFLRKMSEKNLVTEVRMGGLPARYELTPRRHHDHLTCESCQKIVEFENLEIERLQKFVARSHGFKLTGHILELYGLCSECQNLKSP